MVEFAVPAQPTDTHGWRKTCTGLTDDRGGAAVQGDWLQAGDTVNLPAGTLVVAVDKVTTGWDYAYRSGERIRVEDAAVAVLLVDEAGPRELWSRHFKQAKSAFGATTTRRLTALLAEHPPPTGTVELVTEARRPNRRAEPCVRCRVQVPAGLGHLVGYGADATVEHWQTCPTSSAPAVQTQDRSRRSRKGTCDECGQRPGRHERRDSSGIPGVVCDTCNREPDYCLSFA